eukprot:g39133.t1
MHECHAAILRRDRVSARVQSGATWAAQLLQRTNGAFSVTDLHRTGTFNQDTLTWEGDSKCITIWGDANHSKSSRFGRAWLVASAGAGQIEQGSFLSEEWRDEDEDLFVAESGEDAASRRELFNYLQDVERKIFQSWFECHPAAKTAGWLVNEAVCYLESGLAYNTTRSYTSGVNRLKAFAETFASDAWAIRWCWRGIKRSKRKGKDNRLTLTIDLLEKAVSFAVEQLISGRLSPRAKHDLIVLCTIMLYDAITCFWFRRLESSALSVGLNRGKAQPMFRWADGNPVERARFVTDARALLARAGVDDGTKFNGISLRRGGAKSLKLAGASDIAIMRAGRWSSDCFRRYIETPRDEILQEQRNILDSFMYRHLHWVGHR